MKKRRSIDEEENTNSWKTTASLCVIVRQRCLESSHSQLVPVNVLTVTGMLARWGGFADDSPESRPSAWGGQRQKNKTTWWEEEWQKDHSARRWMGSPRRFSYTEAKMSTIGSIYVRSKKPSDNRSRMLQVRTEPQADSAGEHNASMSRSRIQCRLMLPPKIPIWDKNICQGPSWERGFTLPFPGYSSLFKSRDWQFRGLRWQMGGSLCLGR